MHIELKRYLKEFTGQQSTGRVKGASPDAYLPIPMAAAALGVEPTTVRRYLKEGKLRPFDVTHSAECGEELDRWAGVSAVSVQKMIEDRKREYQKLADRILPILEKQKGRPIQYGELMEKVDLSWRNPHHRRITGEALGWGISERTLKERGFMLSALVVSKDTGRPNESFFWFGKSLGAVRPNQDEISFWKSQMNKINAYYAQRDKAL